MRIIACGVPNIRYFEDRPQEVSTVNIPKTAAGSEYVGDPPCLQAITCKFVPDEPIPNLELRQSAMRKGLTRGKKRFFLT